MFNAEKILCIWMLSYKNIFFHIKGSRIPAIKLSILTSFVKIFYQRQTYFESTITSYFYTIVCCDDVENNNNNDHESDIH